MNGRLRGDLLIAAALAALAMPIASAARKAFVTVGGSSEYAQHELGAAVALACGRGFTNPAADQTPLQPALTEFLARTRESVTCADLPPVIPPGKPSFSQGLYRYLMYTIALTWALTGSISVMSLTPLFALAYAATLVAAYGIFRVAMSRLMAVVATLPAPDAARDPRVHSFPADLIVTADDLAATVTPISGRAMQFRAPIVGQADERWTIRGRAQSAYSYVLRTRASSVLDDVRLLARGRVKAGGLSVGLLQNDRWAAQVSTAAAGEFIIIIEPPQPGVYDVVVANNVADPSLATDVVIDRLGWVPR